MWLVWRRRQNSIYLVVCLVLVLVLGVSSPALSANQPAMNWESPIPTGFTLLEATWGNGLFVAVGSYGVIATSDNGEDWTVRESGTDEWLWSVYFDEVDDRFIAVGDGSTMLSSSDGVAWIPVPISINSGDPSIRSVARGSGIWVAPTDLGTMVSTDGLSWTFEPEAADDPDYMSVDALGNTYRNVIYADGYFCMVGFPHAYLAQSNDGLHWDVNPAFDGWTDYDINDVAYCDGKWVAVADYQNREGHIFTCTVGSRIWSHEDSGMRKLFGVASQGGELAAAGEDVAFCSDGDNWSLKWEYETSANHSLLQGMTAGDGIWVAVGFDGLILRSTTGTDWQEVSSGSTADLMGVAYAVNQDRCLAVGQYATVVDSGLDGEWPFTSCRSDLDYYHAVVCGQDSSGDDLFAMVRANSIFGDSGCVMTSADGIVWTEVTPQNSDIDMFDITYGGGEFVAIGTVSAVSADGYDWEPGLPNQNGLRAIAYGEGKYVAVGPYNYSEYSEDGLIWTEGDYCDANAVAYGTGVFVAVGDGNGNSEIQVSEDGIEWNSRSTGDYPQLNGVAYGAGYFVAVGDDGVAYYSTDSLNWQAIDTDLAAAFEINLNKVCFDSTRNTFIVVGDGGTILTWQPVPGGTAPGDVNNDSSINITDAVLVLKYITNPTQFINEAAADVNGDHTINITDAVKILKHITNPDLPW